MEEEIKNSIKNALLKGVSRGEVVEILKNAGWAEEKINNVLLEVENEIGMREQEGKIAGEEIRKEEVSFESSASAEGQFYPSQEPSPSQSAFQQYPSTQSPSVPPSQVVPSSPSTGPSAFSYQVPTKPLFDSQGRRICSYCGMPLKEKNIYCPNCGKLVVDEVDLESRKSDRKGFAIASFIFGILGFIPVFAILGIIFGILGRKSSKKGLAIAGIILSFSFFIFISVVLLISFGKAANMAKIVRGMEEIKNIAHNKDSYLEIKDDQRVKEISREIKNYGGKDFVINISPDGRNFCAEVKLSGYILQPKISNLKERWYCVDNKGAKGENFDNDPSCSSTYFSCK